MSIKINRYTPINSQGNTVGFCSFTFVKTGQFFNDCPVVRKNNGGFFVASPSRSYDGEDGVKRYMPYWGFEDRTTSEKFQKGLMDAVMAHWEVMKAEQAKNQAPPAQEPVTNQAAPAQGFDDSECPF